MQYISFVDERSKSKCFVAKILTPVLWRSMKSYYIPHLGKKMTFCFIFLEKENKYENLSFMLDPYSMKSDYIDVNIAKVISEYGSIVVVIFNSNSAFSMLNI